MIEGLEIVSKKDVGKYYEHLKKNASNAVSTWSFTMANGGILTVPLWKGNNVVGWEIRNSGNSKVCDITLRDGSTYEIVFDDAATCFKHMNDFWEYRNK